MSILIAAAGAGRCFGWQPLAKVSMMIMRPPQQRHGRGSTRGPSAAAVSNVLAGSTISYGYDPVFEDARLEPFTDQADDALVADPVFQEP